MYALKYPAYHACSFSLLLLSVLTLQLLPPQNVPGMI